MNSYLVALAIVMTLIGSSMACAYSAWTDTDNVAFHGKFGKAEITLNTYGITLSPDYLYPGFTQTYDVQVINTGAMTLKLTATNYSVPAGIVVSTIFDVPTITRGTSTTAHIKVYITQDLNPAYAMQYVDFQVAITGNHK